MLHSSILLQFLSLLPFHDLFFLGITLVHVSSSCILSFPLYFRKGVKVPLSFINEDGLHPKIAKQGKSFKFLNFQLDIPRLSWGLPWSSLPK